MDALASWARAEVTLEGETREVYRKGSGPGVIIIHEIPGIEPSLIDFADEVVGHGYTVVLPRLFGGLGEGYSFGNISGEVRQFCVRREFSVFALGKTSPIAMWLRALSRQLHDEVGGPGVGVIGMCFTGGFALAMMADAPVVAPVLAEPSLPMPVGFGKRAAARGADLGLDAADLQAVKASGCEVLGLRYRTDSATGTRFDTLRRELGDRFLSVEFEAKGHSVLTGDRREYGVGQVLAFLDRKLPADRTPPVAPRDTRLEHELEARLGAGFEAHVTADPRRVVLLVRRGLTSAGVARAEQLSLEITGQRAEIAKVTPAWLADAVG